MKKFAVLLLCAGMLTTGFVLGNSWNEEPEEHIEKSHEIQYVVDRIEEGKWVVVEVYDKTIDATMMIDIKIEEGYKVRVSEWVY